MKKLLVIVLAAMMVIGMAACSTEGEKKDAPDASDGKVIGLAVSTLNNPFFVTLKEGAEAKAKELGAELITLDAGDDAATQTSNIEDLLSKNIQVLIVNPVDSEAVAPAVQEALDKGVKVIAVDRAVEGAEVDCSIASDNVAGAEMAAEFLVKEVGKGAKAAELEGVNGASATIDRGKGFHNIADKDLDVVAKQTAEFNRDKGLTVMENILQANPDIKCVFAHNDEMALGALEAIGDKDIIVAGFDATDDALAAIKEGKMAATVAQKPDLMGATAVETASKMIDGEEVEASIPVEVKLITKENVDE